MPTANITLGKIDQLSKDGLVTIRPHPVYSSINVVNYSTKCQIDKAWDRYTIQCRGLIMEGDKILGRPFKKFFNVGELQGLRNNLHELYGVKYSDIPTLPFTTTTKLDGSLGIYCQLFPGVWDWATRGSFTSEQAELARKIWRDKYSRLNIELDPNFTYLFEIVAPENRIVLKYNELDIILIGVIHTEYAYELSYDQITQLNLPFQRPLRYKFSSMEEATTIAKSLTNEEGYVLDWNNGFRAKCKADWYCDIHKIVSDLTPRKVFQALQNGSIQTWMETVPDEFFTDIDLITNEITNKFDRIKQQAVLDFNNIYQYKFFEYRDPNDRAGFAALAKQKQYPQLMFAMYDKRDITELVWKILEKDY